MKAIPKAFPYMQQRPDGVVVDCDYGMALRDYFAAKAMQALLSTTKDEQWFPDEVASIAYEMANAMIKESEKQ